MAKPAIVDYFNKHNQFPSNNLAAGLPSPSDIQSSGMDSLEISTTGIGKDSVSLITVSFNKEVDKGKTLIVSASFPEKGADIIWDCRGGTLPIYYRPFECRP